MTRLTLVCHAPTAATRAARFPEDEEIDDAGLDVAARMQAFVGRRLISAPERRATLTAAKLAGDGEIAIDPDLRDWDCGRWRGESFATLQQSEPDALRSWLSDPGVAPHGGESLAGLITRTGTWLEAQAIGKARTIAITHPAVLRAAVVQALQAGPVTFWHLDVPPLCRVQLSHDGRRWLLQGLLPPPRPRR